MVLLVLEEPSRMTSLIRVFNAIIHVKNVEALHHLTVLFVKMGSNSLQTKGVSKTAKKGHSNLLRVYAQIAMETVKLVIDLVLGLAHLAIFLNYSLNRKELAFLHPVLQEPFNSTRRNATFVLLTVNYVLQPKQKIVRSVMMMHTHILTSSFVTLFV